MTRKDKGQESGEQIFSSRPITDSAVAEQILERTTVPTVLTGRIGELL